MNSTQKILVSLDGGVSYQEAKEGVRVIFENVAINGDEDAGDLHLNATHEGLITDLYIRETSTSNRLVETKVVPVEDVVSDLSKAMEMALNQWRSR